MHVCGVIPASVCHISAQCCIASTEAYRYKLASFSIPQSPHYIKKAQGCAKGRGLVPLCGFLTFQCDLPSAGPQPMCHTAGGRSLCGICGRGSTTHAAYTAGVPQSMRYIQRGLRNLYYATIYPTEIYKVPFDTFRLSVELPIQKHTDIS